MSKKLTKSNSNIVFSGSLAGIAEYIGIDPTVVRILYVIVTLFTGFPVIAYIALMLLMPSGDKRQQRGTYSDPYQHPYNGNKSKSAKRPRKEAEKVEGDDWSDF